MLTSGCLISRYCSTKTGGRGVAAGATWRRQVVYRCAQRRDRLRPVLRLRLRPVLRPVLRLVIRW
jgi:hypothetical protein